MWPFRPNSCSECACAGASTNDRIKYWESSSTRKFIKVSFQVACRRMHVQGKTRHDDFSHLLQLPVPFDPFAYLKP